MTFDELLAQIQSLLQREQRLSYRALKIRFELDDDHLEALKEELIYAKRLAADEDGRVLVWTGAVELAPAPLPRPAAPATPDQERAPRAYTPRHLAEKILTARRDLAGERKQVTVLFADLKDSTELIRGLDPEAAQQLLDPTIQIMMDAVHRFEGTVNQVLGDGIMALFGAPIAHEDHALRACYAALAMQAAMRSYTEAVRRTRGLELCMRVGLNAGEVVVRAIGNDLHMDYSAVGETTHLAARMEQMATPGTIRLTAATLRLVEGLVQVTALGPVPIKGLPEPVAVFELEGASSLRRRLQAAVGRGLTPFVGRHPELAALHQALERAGAGQGWRVLESASVSYGKATSYFPVIDLLTRYSHIEEHDDSRTRRAKVTGQVLTLDEVLLELRSLGQVTEAQLHNDWRTRRAIERDLQVLIEIMIDVCQRLIALAGQTPGTTAREAIERCVQLGVLARYEAYHRMVQFRNFIVHHYERIDTAILVDIVNRRLGDVERFRDEILAYVQR